MTWRTNLAGMTAQLIIEIYPTNEKTDMILPHLKDIQPLL